MASSSSCSCSSSPLALALQERKRQMDINLPDLDIPECPVCTDSFVLKAPICLPSCGHSVCKTCLSKLLEQNPAKCPKCRVKIERAALDSFPVNWDLKHILMTMDGWKAEARRKQRLANRRIIASAEEISLMGPEPMLDLLTREFKISEPKKFTCIMNSVKAVIAGGVALLAICRNKIPEPIASIWGQKTDLDVWIPHNPRRLEAAEPFHEFLLDSGYEFQRRLDIDNTEYKRLKLFLDHICQYESRESTIQLMVLKRDAEIVQNIDSFDIDVCRVSFDGEKFHSSNGDIYSEMKITDNALKDLHFREWPRTLKRLSKYVGRGFDLDIPETLSHYAKLVAKSIFSRESDEFDDVSKWLKDVYAVDDRSRASAERVISYFKGHLYCMENILSPNANDMVQIDYLSKSVTLVGADGSLTQAYAS